jgi:hypothetical protein
MGTMLAGNLLDNAGPGAKSTTIEVIWQKYTGTRNFLKFSYFPAILAFFHINLKLKGTIFH